MSQQFTLLLPLSVVITSNRAAQTWRRQKTKNALHRATRLAAHNLVPCGRATILVGITKRTRGAYDPVNLTDTFKGCVDELVTMGVLDEDDYRHVVGPWLYHAGVDPALPAGHLRATVTLTRYTAYPVTLSA